MTCHDDTMTSVSIQYAHDGSAHGITCECKVCCPYASKWVDLNGKGPNIWVLCSKLAEECHIRIQTTPDAMDEEDGELCGGTVGGTGKVNSSPCPKKGARRMRATGVKESRELGDQV
jgi:hypothetical protein